MRPLRPDQIFHYEQATDPVTVQANEWWADTANQIIYRRNAANTAWVQYSGNGGGIYGTGLYGTQTYGGA